MPNVVRFPESISGRSVSSDKATRRRSQRDAFVSVALFSAIGLLISLVAVLLRVPGVWY
jgi:hypothetical protein